MFKITEDGKTIVGNNEDWVSLNSKIWFEPAGENRYGAAYLGFIDDFPQGAMNEAGLVFDGFITDYLPVKNNKGKISKPAKEVVHFIMRNLGNVHEVEAYLSQVDLTFLSSTVLMFVDKAGEYLIVEGDILTIANEPIYIQSNFIPSKSPVKKTIDIQWYQNGLKYIESSQPEPTTIYCSSVMAGMKHRDTQYTSIYDLNAGIIKLYHFHNYKNPVEINLKVALTKPAHAYLIPELFPESSPGVIRYRRYNDLSEPAGYLRDIWDEGVKKLDAEEVEAYKRNSGLDWLINHVGYEWLRDKKEVSGAIAIFKFGTEIYPQNANLHDSLGEAYWVAKAYKAAISSYGLSLSLNPENLNAIDMLTQIKKVVDEK